MEKATSEIAKLTERISKDPKSKLFVPLAEEYKKAGEIEMAVEVLLEGLKNNPSYVTARSFLGRLLMEKGDLAGAQKELEEVIKAIPDNLLAQRKLGDIYVLQGKSKDALDRYRAALALNPGDKEVPSLIADIEAGKDISARIPRPKVPAPPAPIVKPQPAAAPVPPKAVPAAVAKPAAPSLPKAAPTPISSAAVQAPPRISPPASAPAASVAPGVPPPPPAQTATPAPPVPPTPPVQPRPEAGIPPAAAIADEAEVIEDIVDIEPIEQLSPAASELKRAEATSAPVSQPERQSAPKAPEAAAFDLSEQPMDMGISVEDPTSVVWGGEETVPRPGKPAAAEEGGDDLNTNTLAELYITQGFYDKAIEVYQGMLAERPGNKALQNKLEQLRAMAGTAETASSGFTAITAGPGEYTPPSADVFADAAEAPAAVAQSTERAMTELPAAKEKPPVEASAPKVVPEQAPETPIPAGPQAASVRRKETIDRLESWLKNIMKENH